MDTIRIATITGHLGRRLLIVEDGDTIALADEESVAGIEEYRRVGASGPPPPPSDTSLLEMARAEGEAIAAMLVAIAEGVRVAADTLGTPPHLMPTVDHLLGIALDQWRLGGEGEDDEQALATLHSIARDDS